MQITKTNEVRQELILMTREIAAQEELNYKLTQCIERRLVVPTDQPELRKSAEGIAQVTGLPAEKIIPLISLARQIGIEDEGLPSFLRRMEPHLTIYRAKELMENPYFQKIHMPQSIPDTDTAVHDSTDGRFRLQNTEFLDGELFFDKEPVADGYARVNTLGIFEGNLYYPGFYEGDRCWMSITPNEIVTMQAPIERAKGKVLTLGLGLGYYAYMVHLKDDVESVTIIEREQTVIDLFEKYILPQFDHPEKIRIIRADAFAFMEGLTDGTYDYSFADIWQNPLDGMEDYLRLVRIGNRFVRMNCDYWIEESFIGRLELFVANILQFEFLGEDDSSVAFRPGYREVKRLLAGTQIATAEDVRGLFGGEFVKGILGRVQM